MQFRKAFVLIEDLSAADLFVIQYEICIDVQAAGLCRLAEIVCEDSHKECNRRNPGDVKKIEKGK